MRIGEIKLSSKEDRLSLLAQPLRKTNTNSSIFRLLGPATLPGERFQCRYEIPEPYEVIRKLHSPIGYTTTYLVKDKGGKCHVLKEFYRPSLNDDNPPADKEFYLEANLGSHLNHPNMVLGDTGNYWHLGGGFDFFSMRFIHGKDLQFALDLLQSRHLHESVDISTLRIEKLKPYELFFLSLSDYEREVLKKDLLNKVLKSLTGITSALTYLEENGLTHRDLKPKNIMLSMESGELESFLIDFYSLYSPDITKPTVFHDIQPSECGTVGYFAPEQLIKKCFATPKTDIFQIATVLKNLTKGHMISDKLRTLINDGLKPHDERPTSKEFHERYSALLVK